jgi:polyisoprenoid-binding protein YceI
MSLATATPVGTWVLDPTRAAVSFAGRASRLAPTFRASFGSVSGTVEVGDTAHLAVDVDVTSLTTGNRSWDELLRSLDPFDAHRCRFATYRGAADPAGNVTGDLALRGVLRPLSLRADVRHLGDELHVTASGAIDRRAFGVRCDLPGIGRLVPSVMALAIDVVAVRRR